MNGEFSQENSKRRLAQEGQRREGSRSAHQMDPADLSGPGTDQEGDEDKDVIFAHWVEMLEEPPPAPETVQAATDREIQLESREHMISCALRTFTRDKALADLSAMVREYGSPPTTMRPHPVIQLDVLNEDSNLRAADIGITWAGNETFLHGVRVIGPGPPRPAGMGPVMSTPYQPT